MSEEQLKKAIKIYKSGANIIDTSKAVKVSCRKLSRIFRKDGIMRKRKTTGLTQHEINLQVMYAICEGMSLAHYKVKSKIYLCPCGKKFIKTKPNQCLCPKCSAPHMKLSSQNFSYQVIG